jgi:hypothetical protein
MRMGCVRANLGTRLPTILRLLSSRWAAPWQALLERTPLYDGGPGVGRLEWIGMS